MSKDSQNRLDLSSGTGSGGGTGAGEDSGAGLKASVPKDDFAPLAERLRPQHLRDYIGQSHLVGDGKPLGEMARRGELSSMILWGPPGTGKTTLARLLAASANAEVISLSAVLAGVKDVREAVTQAEMWRMQGRGTVVFVDEVHRFNKAQQDAFLPHVEKGTLVLIGATTENPSFEVNSALLSRARVFVLQPLSEADLRLMASKALELLDKQADEQAIELLVEQADGDARRMYNLLEIAAQLAPDSLSVEQVVECMGDRLRRFDKGGDVFYEQISALHKALRGSAPDAALYWFCRMLDGGADPLYIGRRLIRFASEDVGNADPRALDMTLSAVQAYERLGSPEGELALAQSVLYLASVPKSNAAYAAFNEALAYVKNSPGYAVPMHLRNAPTNLMKDLGYGDNYRYAHGEETEEGAYAAGENYFPQDMPPQQFYKPQAAGLEDKISKRLQRLRELDAKVGKPPERP